jgi:hypothetical protein
MRKRVRGRSFDADKIYNLHIVVDGRLRQRLEEFARRIENLGPVRLPNASGAVRELMRTVLMLPTAISAEEIQNALAIVTHAKTTR